MKMLERQRVQQAAVDAAKKLADATKESEETATTAAAAAALSAPEEAQVSLSGSTATAACWLCAHISDRHVGLLLCA